MEALGGASMPRPTCADAVVPFQIGSVRREHGHQGRARLDAMKSILPVRFASIAATSRVVLVLGATLFAACSTKESTTGSTYSTPSTTCSDGPRWPRGTNFDYERGGPTDAPACTPHCGPNQPASALWGGRALTSDALPSGTCAESSVVCTMSAEWLGPCPPEGSPIGPLDLFICRCTSGIWACTVDATAPAATAWSCRLPDGGDFDRPDSGDAGSTVGDSGR